MTRFFTRARLAVAFTGLMAVGLGSLGDATAGTEYEGNPTCANLGFEMSQKIEDPSGSYTVDHDGLTALFTIGTYPDVADPNPDNAVVVFELASSSAVSTGVVVVKGGDGATLYGFGDALPFHSPVLDNGTWPTISHVQLCWNEPEPEPEFGLVEVTKVLVGEPVGDLEPGDLVFEVCLTGPLPDETVRCRTVEGSGVMTFEAMAPGEYLVAETDPGVGFAVGYSAASVTVVAGETAAVTVTNTYEEPDPELGRVEVTKVLVGEPVGDLGPGDLVFEVCLTGPLPDETVQCRTVEGSGVMTFEGLVPGEYHVAESAPGEGYLVEYSTESVNVIAGETVAVTVTNTLVRIHPPTTPAPTTPAPTTPAPTTPAPTTPAPTTPTTPPSSVAQLPAGGEQGLPPTGLEGGAAGLAAFLVLAGSTLVLASRRPGRSAR